MSSRAPICLIACDEALDLAAEVGRCLGQRVTASKETWFSCGEAKHAIDENVRGSDVYVFQRPIVPGSDRSVYDRTIGMLHAVDAARHADARRVTLVVPYFPGSRQDKRKGHAREGVTTSLFARMWMAAGVDMVITVDPHNEATIGAFDPSRCVFEAVSVDGPFSRFLDAHGLAADVVASTDVGGLERARHYAQRLGKPIAALAKERDYSRASTVTTTTVIGDVGGRSVLIVDDIVDTAGSMVSAVQSLWEKGATDIVIAGVHLILSGQGRDRLDALHAEATGRGRKLRVVGTSSILHPNPPEWWSTFALEPLLAQVISSVNTRSSVRALE